MKPDDIAGALRATPHRRRKAARPDELLDAALDLFAEKGFAATRSEEVAHRAGVSKGTLYLYYPSKEELLRAVISQRLSAQIAEVSQAVARHPGTPGQVIEDLLPLWWQQVFDSPTSAVFKLIVTEVRNFPEIAAFYMAQVVEPGQKLLGSLVQRGIDEGEFQAVDVDSAVLSLILPLVMVCVQKHSLAACLPPEVSGDAPGFMRRHVELIVRGLRAGGPNGYGRARFSAPSATDTAPPTDHEAGVSHASPAPS